MPWIRTCQECGNAQKHTEPEYGKEPSDSYQNTKCRKCKSMALDYGSNHIVGCTKLINGNCTCTNWEDEE